MAMLAAALLLGASVGSKAVNPQDYAVQVVAQVETAPPRIVLQWPLGSFATGYTVSRKLLGEQTWAALATLPAAATGFIDSNIVASAGYEYEIAQSNTDGLLAYGYIYAGMEVPFPEARGRIVLVVDSTYANDLAAELSQLQQDLVGDGWTVLRHDVLRAGAPGDVKALVLADYQADSSNTKAVFLFGHVPVPYSGDIDPDMHQNHLGAWPADVFYGELSGTWTDSTVTDVSAEDPRNHNVPGDGKFDQSAIPGTVVLQVGRVDFNDLPSFAPRTELDLLRQYLSKDHAFRFKAFDLARRGLIRDNFGDINGDAPATDAWRAFPAFFGPGQISVIGAGQFFPTLDSASYLWVYGGGGGEYYQADGVGSTSDFAAQRPQAAFFMLDGSYFGDWDSTDNLLRAVLASAGDGLVAAWTGLPHWFMHHMALGGTIGFSTLITANNQGLYKNHINLSASQVHISLMGDPTLRMHVVAPPTNLTAVSLPDNSVVLAWTASKDVVQGYYVYRADSLAGPFARLTRSFVTGTTYTESGAPLGQKSYMVRAIKLEQSGSGSYYNPSQGVFTSVAGADEIESIARQEGGSALLQFAGAPGVAYTVEASQDLVNWIPLGGGAFGTNTTASYLDGQGRTNVWRFYRIASP
jgi:hypothetical protein